MGFGGGNTGMGMDMGMMGMDMGMGRMDGFGGMDFGHHQHQPQHHQQQQQQHQQQQQPQQEVQHAHDQHQQQPSPLTSPVLPTLRSDQPLVPVTPASIMNLGRLGINSSPGGSGRLASSLSASSKPADAQQANSPVMSLRTTSTRSNKRKDSVGATGMPTRSGRTTRRTSALMSPSLKPLLPGMLSFFRRMMF